LTLYEETDNMNEINTGLMNGALVATHQHGQLLTHCTQHSTIDYLNQWIIWTHALSEPMHYPNQWIIWTHGLCEPMDYV